DRYLLEPTPGRPVHLNLDFADACEVDALAGGAQAHTVARGRLFESETRVAPAPHEAREPWLLAGLDAAKERPVGTVESSDGALQEVRVDTQVLPTYLTNV